jgi:hypothetical protein
VLVGAAWKPQLDASAHDTLAHPPEASQLHREWLPNDRGGRIRTADLLLPKQAR